MEIRGFGDTLDRLDEELTAEAKRPSGTDDATKLDPPDDEYARPFPFSERAEQIAKRAANELERMQKTDATPAPEYWPNHIGQTAEPLEPHKDSDPPETVDEED